MLNILSRSLLVRPSLHVNHLIDVPIGKRLVGPVVKESASEAVHLGLIPAFAVKLFHGWSHTSDSKFGTLLATLLGAWRYRVSSGTGCPGVSVL